jgi:hypothetical protein
MVLFNRSWYNRAGVERVMGFCTEREYERFLEDVLPFEHMLIGARIQILKYYLDISKREHAKRLRRHGPLKEWKMSAVDKVALKRFDDHSEARDRMLERTSTPPPRHQRQRQQQGTELRKPDRVNHRVEELRFDPLESEQWQVRADNDQCCEEDWPRDLAGGIRGVGLIEGLFRGCLSASQDCLHHYDGRVHDDTKIDRTKRQQICRYFEDIHQNKNGYHGERNGDADYHGAAGTAEEKEEHEQDKYNPLENGTRDFVDCLVDKIRAIVIGRDADVIVRQALVQLSDLRMDSLQHPRWILALQ